MLETIVHLVRDYGIEFYRETIVHNNQGAPYTCLRFIDILKDNHLRQSMSRKGNCWDNAPQDRFFGHMKNEIMEQLIKAETHDEIKLIIDDYIDYYNDGRYQW